MYVREIQPREYEALAELTVAAYRALPGGGLSERYERDLRDVAARATEALVLVAVDGEPLGGDGAPLGGDGALLGDDGVLLGGVTYVPDPSNPHAEFDDPDAAGIRMLAVDPPAWGRGAATALVQECIDRARADGRARILLHSTPWMAGAQRLYRRIGFTRREDIDWRPMPDVELLGYGYELG